MPYSKEHTERSRAKIVEAARILFNVHGFERVTIDMVMAKAGMTRGGFYKHFESKEALYSSAVESFLMGRGAIWRDEAGIDPSNLSPKWRNICSIAICRKNILATLKTNAQ